MRQISRLFIDGVASVLEQYNVDSVIAGEVEGEIVISKRGLKAAISIGPRINDVTYAKMIIDARAAACSLSVWPNLTRCE